MKDHVEIGHLTKYDACKSDLTKYVERMMMFERNNTIHARVTR